MPRGIANKDKREKTPYTTANFAGDNLSTYQPINNLDTLLFCAYGSLKKKKKKKKKNQNLGGTRPEITSKT